MFGYVQPLRCELRVREDEAFRAVYCGLCHTLRQEYGLAARFVLSYDFTFLALLLAKETKTCRKRCVVSPFKKKRAVQQDAGLSNAAAASVISTWWKFCDEIADQRGVRRLAAKGARWFFCGAYRKAREKIPSYDEAMRQSVWQLEQLEKQKEPVSMDAAADTFATSLRSLASLAPESQVRPLRELLYHVGRWIYLIDAADDLEKDFASGNFNPLIQRYHITCPPLGKEALDSLAGTVNHSLYLARMAWELLPVGPYSAIVENTLTLGLPQVQQKVLSGTYHQEKHKKEKDRSIV